jgi:sugar phosphate isomerase/epimerase
MRSTLHRREFLKLSAAAGLALSPGALLAVEPFQRLSPPRLRLSLAAYSFRDYFKDTNHARDTETDVGKRIDLFRFVDYCAEQGCDGAELTSYYFPKDTDDAFLIKLRRHCFLRGVEVSGTSVGNTFTDPPGAKRDEQLRLVKKWVDHAAVLGAPHIRVFAGSTPQGMTQADAKKLCIAALEEYGDYAGKRGIFLGIENHGGIVAEADELLDIVRTVKCPWIGINLDSGNFHTDEPYRDFERCAPYAVNVQMKAEMRARGGKTETADLARFVKMLRAANYQGYVALEYESKEDPWKAVPGLLQQMKALFNA